MLEAKVFNGILDTDSKTYNGDMHNTAYFIESQKFFMSRKILLVWHCDIVRKVPGRENMDKNDITQWVNWSTSDSGYTHLTDKEIFSNFFFIKKWFQGFFMVNL